MTIDHKEEGGKLNPLIPALVASLTEALQLTVQMRRLHAYNCRSPAMIELYWELWLEKNQPIFDDLDDHQKGLASCWFTEIENVLDMGREQESAEFANIRKLSIVFLADILENLIESFLHVCLQYHLPNNKSVLEITGFKKFSETYEGYRRSIRFWERTIDSKSRLERFCVMIQFFFPDYDCPKLRKENLDSLISYRNEITHELIDLSGRSRALPGEDQIQAFFQDMGDFVVSLIGAFTSAVRIK